MRWNRSIVVIRRRRKLKPFSVIFKFLTKEKKKKQTEGRKKDNKMKLFRKVSHILTDSDFIKGM